MRESVDRRVNVPAPHPVWPVHFREYPLPLRSGAEEAFLTRRSARRRSFARIFLCRASTLVLKSSHIAMASAHFVAFLARLHAEIPDASSNLLTRLRRQRRAPILKILMRTILSHQTTNRQTSAAIERLWASYKTIDRMAEANPTEIERLIRSVGLGWIKARRLVAIAVDIKERWKNERQLARYLRTAPLEDARRALMDLPGVGPKSAAVVLLFRFNRPTFPVDTNILRVARKLGWIREGAGPEDVRALVESTLPKDPALLLKAHAYLIALGRVTQRGRREDLIARLRDINAGIARRRPPRGRSFPL